MIIELICVFVLAFVMIFLVQKYAMALGLVDIPNERSVHVEHTPRGAGIGFYLAVLLVVPFFHLDLILSYFWTFFAIFLVFIVGVLDDHHDTSAHTKFFVIMLSTLLLFFDNLVIDNLGTFFGLTLSLGWFALPFTLFAVVGFTNALNLIDGLDGLSGTISIIVLSTFLWVGYIYQDLFMIVLSSTFIVTLLAFLIYNWHPASIFMGDSGSLTLGFVISILAIKSLAYLPTVSILFIAALPIFDTLIVMIRRKRAGRSAFSADRCHMHHLLRYFFKGNTQQTVLFLGVFQSIYSITGLQLDKDIDNGLLLILFLLNLLMLYILFKAILKRDRRKC